MLLLTGVTVDGLKGNFEAVGAWAHGMAQVLFLLRMRVEWHLIC